MTTVQSVERAFSVLQVLAAGPTAVSDIAARTALPKSTVSRLLSTLSEIGAVEPTNSAGTYALGSLIVDLSSAAAPADNLIAVARPQVGRLVAKLGEAAGLSVLDGTSVYYLDQLDGEHEVQVGDWTGERVDAHVVSSGLVLMASAPAELRERFLESELRSFTAHTITDPVLIAHRLDDVARAGFAWVYEEMAEGMNSVAAPVVNHAGTVVAAVHVHGPSYRFPADGAAAAIAAEVVDTARQISDRLAGNHAVN
jgi:IclR family acetate operon transcriptional repressor